MANLKISQLPTATLPLSGSESVEIVQGGSNVKAPASALGNTQLMAIADGAFFSGLAADATREIIRIPFNLADFADSDFLRFEGTLSFTVGSGTSGTAILHVTDFGSAVEARVELTGVIGNAIYAFRLELAVRQDDGSIFSLSFLGTDAATAPSLKPVFSFNYNLGDGMDGSELVFNARLETPGTVGNSAMSFRGGTLTRMRV